MIHEIRMCAPGGLPRREPPNDLKECADEGISRHEIRAVHLILKSTNRL